MTTSAVIRAPYGSWRSPISIDQVIGGGLKIGAVQAEGEAVSWLESRPAESGRSTLLTLREGAMVELTPVPYYVRSRVHEYGGGAWVSRGDLTIFSNVPDSRLYRIDAGVIRPITPPSDYRYADLQLDAAGTRLFAVREDHSLPGAEAVNTIVVLDPNGPNADSGEIIVSGTDFVSSLCLDATGERVAWLSWNHPNMPWDGCDLNIATLDPDQNNVLTDIRHVAGGITESIVQPRFLPDGRLGFVSDRSGWWNLHAFDLASGETVNLAPREAEFGFPQWQFAHSMWDIVSDTELVTAWYHDGDANIGVLDLATGDLRRLDQPFTTVRGLYALQGNVAIANVASASEPTRLVRFDLADGSFVTLRGETPPLDAAEIAVPEALAWPTPDGATAHGFYYPPTNSHFTGLDGELPPLIVESHGGPTSASGSEFSLARQFWTNRGFAILDVNYGGSTGYGRAYRERLNGAWGIVDVQDCISGVEALEARRLVDPTRVIIRGGSAGGYTTLAALTGSRVFRIGTSYFGVGDLEALATDTHKFESRYLDNLVGPYPERKDLYIERSPVHHTDRLAAAMLLLQGLDDKVVPPNQSAAMAAAVRAKGLPVAHLEFENEGHGFRGVEAQRRSIEAELSFYSQILGFPLADNIPPLPIENL